MSTLFAPAAKPIATTAGFRPQPIPIMDLRYLCAALETGVSLPNAWGLLSLNPGRLAGRYSALADGPDTSLSEALENARLSPDLAELTRGLSTRECLPILPAYYAARLRDREFMGMWFAIALVGLLLFSWGLLLLVLWHDLSGSGNAVLGLLLTIGAIFRKYVSAIPIIGHAAGCALLAEWSALVNILTHYLGPDEAERHVTRVFQTFHSTAGVDPTSTRLPKRLQRLLLLALASEPEQREIGLEQVTQIGAEASIDIVGTVTRLARAFHIAIPILILLDILTKTVM